MVGAIFNFLYNQENLLREYEHNSIFRVCQTFTKNKEDICPLEMNNELEQFVVIARKSKKDLTTKQTKKTPQQSMIFCLTIENNY